MERQTSRERCLQEVGSETGGISTGGGTGGTDIFWQTKAASEALEDFTDQSILS